MSLKNVLSAASSYLISQEQGPGDPPNAWDINYYTFGANIQIYQVTEDTFGNGLFFKPDGTKLYYVGNNTDRVYQYSLSTPWDLNTVSYDSKNASVGSQETTPTNIFFKPDGSSFYITGTATDKVHQYNMTTAWDVSTASFFGSKATTVTEATPTGLYFKPDGTSYYICGPASDLVRRFNLATAWDITSTTTVGPTSPNLNSRDSAPESLFFNEDGTKMYVYGDNRQGVWQYLLSTAWDVSTATDDRRLPTNFLVSSLNPRAICLGNNGNYIYLLITNAIFRITLDSSYSLYVNYWSGYPNDYFTNSLTIANITFVSPDGTKAYMIYALNDVIYQFSMSTANDLSTLSYDNKSLDASSFNTVINNIHFSQNGNHLYLSGSAEVYYYTLSTAFDISTATYQNSWTSSQDINSGGLVLSSDGTKMIYLGLATDDLFEYTLSTPYQPTSASYVRNLALSSVNSLSLAAKPDGTKIFVLESSNDNITSISLPTAWSLSGASTTSRTFSPQTTLANNLAPRGLSFNSNGSNLYIYIANANALQKWSVL